MLLTTSLPTSLFFSQKHMIIRLSLFLYVVHIGTLFPFNHPSRFQALEHIGGKRSLDCLALFRHYMVDIIIASSHGYRQGALRKWILGVEDPMATAIADFPKRAIIVRRSALYHN
jgi:hypothetical protein